VSAADDALPPGATTDHWFAVVKPPAAIATPAIFKSENLVRDTKPAIVADFLAHTSQVAQRLAGSAVGTEMAAPAGAAMNVQGHTPDHLGSSAQSDRELYGRNDLQPPAEALCPEVAQVARWLQARFGNSRMTGSGSAVFARAGTGSQPLATWTAAELPPTWVGRLCRSLDSHPLVHWAD
jgi:4-diphosphocytidyl-2-C-methyl-D-erythritol kinase